MGLGPSQSPACFLCSEGSNLTPAHHFQDFRFKTYAPVAFRYFRELFGIRPDDYLVSVSSAAWLGGLDHHLLVVLGLHGAGTWLQRCWAPCSGCHLGLGCGLKWTQLHWVPSKPLASSARLCPCWPGRPFLPDTTVSSVIVPWSRPRPLLGSPTSPWACAVSVTTPIHPPSPFQYSLCNEPLIELSNPGASGSLFYVTSDDEFIIKTVMHKEAEFLQKLLPGYYMVGSLAAPGLRPFSLC